MRRFGTVIQAGMLFGLVACGGGGSSDTSQTPPSVNQSPIFTGTSDLSVLEGQSSVATLQASDPEGSAVSFNLVASGDSQHFTLSSSGDLSFLAAPDFEAPQDSEQDNVYNIEVNASDGNANRSRSYQVSVNNALEGRVVDGPLSGSTVFLDLNGNLQLDGDEISVLSDALGYFAIQGPDAVCQAEGCNPLLVAVGGTDTTTGKLLDNLVMVAEALLSETFTITPLSTLLASADNPQAVLDALGLSLTVDQLLRIDPWRAAENSEPGSALLLKLNQQLAMILQSASGMLAANTQLARGQINSALLSELEDQLVNSGFGVNARLDNSQLLQDLLRETVARLQLDVQFSDELIDTVALQIVRINSILANADVDPVSQVVADILTVAQGDLINAIEDLANESISLEVFALITDAESLFASITLPELLPDLDGDGVIDLLDLDDDGDGVYDFLDSFPRDSTESVDTDNDGIGNNADNDDDNDGVVDTIDDFPLDANLTPPSAVIEVNNESGTIGYRFEFDGSRSVAGYAADTIVHYQWDFGDGSSDSGSSVQHAYSSSGNYQVSLTVENSDQLRDSAILNLTVSDLGEFSIRGTVVVASKLAVDSDTNNPASKSQSNNSLQDAQLLLNPTLLTGYINSPGQGPSGNSSVAGDIDDYYRINALGGEAISIAIADPASTDIDLYLYDSDGQSVGASLGTSRYESLTVPGEPGVYYLQVTIWDAGASNYLLELGLNEGVVTNAAKSASQSTGWSTQVDFAPGDIIVRRRAGQQASVTANITSWLDRAKRRRAGGVDVSLYSYDDTIDEVAAGLERIKQSPGLSRLLAKQAGKTLVSQGRSSELTRRTKSKIATLMAAKALSLDSSVLFAEPNFRRRKLDVQPDDTYFPDQAHLSLVNLPAAWDISTGDSDVKIAVLDTGIYEQHPDLDGRLSSDGYDFVADTDNSGDGDGMDSDPSDPGDGQDNSLCPDSEDEISDFHGTHVAGTVGAESNNSQGVSGVTWAGEIMNLRVLGCSGGSDFDIANALLYAAGLPNESGIIVSDPADIANLSLGGGGYGQTLNDAVAAARAAGLIIVASAGNESLSTPTYPAAYEGVISVSATTASLRLAGYSNYGSTIDISAPGNSVLSTAAELVNGFVDPIYASSSGTSMAAPHVAGTIALMKAVYPDMSPEAFDSVLISGNITQDLGTPGRDNRFGFGLIDAFKALDYAQQLNAGLPIPVTPLLNISSHYLNYGQQLDRLSVVARSDGNAPLQVSAVVASESYITITSPSSANGLGQYDINISRAELSSGTYTGTVSFDSNGGNQTLELIFVVPAVGEIRYGDAGHVVIKATNIDTNETAIVSYDGADQGVYPYALALPGAGTYRVIAGSDHNNDGYTCLGAEACGRYSKITADGQVEVSSGLEGVDFELDYIEPAGIGTAESIE